MAANNGKFTFQVGYSVDQSSINNLRKSLQSLQNIKIGDFKGTEDDLESIRQSAKAVQAALTEAFNPKLNVVSLQTFQQQLQKTDRNLDNIYEDFAKAGSIGKNAFGELTHNIISTNTKLTQTKTLLQSMGQTMMNTVKWGIASSVMNTFTGAVRNAFSYVQSLDAALTDIRIVTGDSTQQMKEFAVQANNAAQALGRSTMDYTKAALTFYQQGLDDQSVQARTEATLKAQNITGAGDQMADYLTAVWNGYRVANEEAQLYVDKLAAVADSSASNMSQLAVAMSKVASTARAMGVDVDSLNAQIATIVGTTRQAPESVGNALKTIYARINDIATGADDAQVSLGNYSQKMAQVGFSVLDANGNLRDTGQVIDQIGGKWQTLSREQQIYLARTMAGQRQYNNLIALFDNWGRYTDLVNVSLDSQGTLMQKNNRYMDSLGAKMEQLGAAGERFKDALIDEQDLKGLTQFGTKAVNVFSSLIEGLGGGKSAILAFSSVLTGIFSNVIGKEIGNVINRNRELKTSIESLAQSAKQTSSLENTLGYKEDPVLKKYIDNSERMQKIWSVMSKQEIKAQEERLNSIRSLEEQAAGYEKTAEAGQKLVNTIQQKRNLKPIDLGISELTKPIQKQIQKIIQKVNATKNQIQKIYKEQFTQESFNKIKGKLESLQTTSGVQFSQQLKKFFENGYQAANKLDDPLGAILRYFGQIKDAADGALNYKKYSQGAEQAKNKAGALKNEFQALQESAEVVFNAQAMTKMASGIGRVVSGFSSLANLFKTLKDDSISAGEKLVQTFTTLGFILPSIVSGVKDIIKGAKAIPDVLSKLANIGDKILENALIKKNTKDTNENSEATNRNTKEKMANAGASAASAGAEAADAAATEIDTKAREANTVAAHTQGEAILAAMGPLIAIVGIIAAVVITVKSLTDAWNQDSKAAQEAAKVSAEAKKEYDNVKKSYQDLKKSFEQYNTAQEAIQNMTKYTQEWRDAIQESNDAVLELISNYPKLADYVTNVNGQLIISDKGQQDILKAQSQRVLNAQAASISASQNSRQANYLNTASSIGKEINTAAYLFRGKTLFGGESVAGKRANQLTENVIKVAEALNKGIQNEVQQLMKATQLDRSTVESILENNKALQDLRQQLRENQSAIKIQNETIAAQVMQDSSTYQNFSDIEKQLANTIGGNAYQQEYDRIYKTILDDFSFNYLSNENNNEYLRILLDQYKKATKTDAIFASNAVTGGNRFGQGAKINLIVDGQNVTLSKQQIANTIAASKALQALGNTAQKTAEMLNAINRIDLPGSTTNSDALKGFIAGNGFGDLTKGQLDSLDAYSQQMRHIFDTYYKEARYESGYEFQQAFLAAQQSDLRRFENIFESYGIQARETFNKAFSNKDFSINTTQNIFKSLSEAYKRGGSELSDSLASVFNDIKPQQIDQFSNLIANIDWTQDGAVYQLNKAIEEQGIEINKTDPAWQLFIKYLDQISSKALNATDALDKFRNSLSKIKDIQNLKTGQIIDDEEYEELIKLNPELQKFFKLAADGRMFIGTQQQVKTVLNNTAQDAVKHFREMGAVAKQVTDQNLADRINTKYILGSDSSSTWVDNTAINQITQDEAFRNALHLIGIDEKAFDDAVKYIQENRTIHTNLLTEQQKNDYANQKAIVEEAFNQIAALQSDYENQLFSDSNESSLWATSSQSLEQLRNYYYQAKISIQDYQDMRQAMVQKQIDDLGITREQYDATYKVLNQRLLETSQSFNILNEAEQQVELDQLVGRCIQLGEALDDLAGISEETFEKMAQTIQSGQTKNVDFVNQMEQIKQVLDRVFNTDIDTSFIEQHFNLISQLANGNINVLNDLQQLLGTQFIAQIVPQVNSQEAAKAVNQINDLILNTDFNEIEIGASLDDTKFFDALQYLVQSCGLSADEANKLLQKIGFEPDVQEVEIPITDFKEDVGGGTYTATYVNPYTGQTDQVVYTDQQYNNFKNQEKLTIPVINGKSRFVGGAKSTNFTRPNFQGNKTTPKTTSPKGGKSGGSSKKPTQAKLAEAKNSKENEKQKVRDPYEQVQKAYERQEQLLDNLQDKEKKLLDRDRVKLLKEQAEELRKQNQIIQERLDISNSAKGDIWKTDPKTTLEYRKWLQANLGARFDDDGRLASRTAAENKAIQNYNKALADADAKYNKQIDSYNKWITNVYNKASAERQQQLKALKEKKDAEKQRAEENHKTDLKNAEDLYKKSIDNLNNYQKKWQDDQKDRKTQRQNDWKAYQNLIESSRIQIKLKVDSGQLERDWLDFEKKFIKKVSDDDILGNAKHSIKELMSYIDSGEIAARNKVIEDIRKSIENIQAGGVDDLYGQNIVKAREDLDALIKDQQDDLLKIQDIVDEVKSDYLDMIDKANDKMQQQVDQYERVNSLIDHDVKLLELIYGDKGLETRQKYYELQKANNQQELDSLKKQQDYWRERMNQQVIGSDAWNKFKQNLDDVTDDLNSKLENMIDERTKQWQNSVNIIINNLNNSLTNGLGTNFLDEQWDYMSDFDDKFLDTFNSTVGVQDVERLYNQALEGIAGNPKAQQRINNLMKEQLKILKEKDNLTQYDLERAKAMLQVEQARMDLEDARNNKTKMRLRRDSQGNYTYQYVADEEKLTDLQQALADAQTNLYNMDKDHYKQNLEDMNQAYRDFLGKQQQLQDELARAMAAGDEAEAERVRNRLNLLEQSYDKMYSALLEDNQYLLEYLGSSFADGMGIDRAAQSAEQFAQTMKDNIPYVASSIQSMVNNIRDLGGLLPATAGAVTGIADAANAWQQDVNKTLETAGTSASDIMNVTDAEGQALDNNIQTTRELITANDDLIASTKLEIKAMQELLSNMDDILAKNFQFDELVKNLREAYNLAQTLYGSTVTADEIPVAQNNVDTTFNSPEDAKAYYTTLAERAQEKFDSGELLTDNDIAQTLSKYLKSNQMSTEELANLIRVSEYIQSITSSMGNLFSHEITSLDSGIGEILSSTTSENGTIDQNVHIDANFPNVTDHNQIEQAFNNLVNIASMYASKRY